MQDITRRTFLGIAGAAAMSLAMGASAQAALAGEASPAEDFEFEEVDGLIAITGYVGQSEEVVVPRSINGSLVGLIWDGAFADKTAIFKVTLPKGVTYIGEGAFEGCISLEEIVLPEGFEGPFYLDTYPEWARLVTPEGDEVAPEQYFDGTSGLPVVEFGSYPQTGEDPEPIQWLVLEEREDGTALLLSRRCLATSATRPYHGEHADVTWESCDLRAWLNGEFLEEAFSDEERSSIVEQHLVNPDNPVYGTPGGADTDDSVFLLSLQEVETLFEASHRDEDEQKRWANVDEDPRLDAYPTQRAVEEGAMFGEEICCYWWLRTPGSSPKYATIIADQIVDAPGWGVDENYGFCAVRPALVVNQEALVR